jgi:hypothetical protein
MSIFGKSKKCDKSVKNAIIDGDYRAVEKTLSKDKSYINRLINDDQTLLHTACRHSQRNVAIILLKYGANVHAVDQSGKTPFHLAVDTGDCDLVELMIAAGSTINDIPSLDGREKVCSVLISCAHNSCMVKILLKAGAKWDYRFLHEYHIYHLGGWAEADKKWVGDFCNVKNWSLYEEVRGTSP